jgi:peptidoglycan/LPS O-acetylase OafA/YrhL
VGRFDQFACGILALRHRDAIARRWPWAAFAIVAFVALFHLFDANGGYYGASGYPTADPAWIALPTIEGLGFACAIALYDGLCKPQDRGFSLLLGRIGAYSYSIYLLHFFVVFRLSDATARWLGPNPSFAACTAIATVAFVAMTPIGWLSFRFVESPFLRLRKPYLR